VRGGVYGDTSTIEIGNDAKTEIAYAVANNLSRWGFKTQINASSPSTTQFTLSIDRLTYTPDSNPAIGKIQIAAAVSVEIRRDNHNYHGHYEASGEMGYVTAPSEAKNNEEINQMLNLALQKIFDDPSLIKFLQN